MRNSNLPSMAATCAFASGTIFANESFRITMKSTRMTSMSITRRITRIIKSVNTQSDFASSSSLSLSSSLSSYDFIFYDKLLVVFQASCMGMYRLLLKYSLQVSQAVKSLLFSSIEGFERFDCLAHRCSSKTFHD